MFRQMRAADVPILAREPYGSIEFGFMREISGDIYFLARFGHETIPYPVLEDGRILREADLRALRPSPTNVELVHPRDLGIAEINWVTRKDLSH